MGEPTRIMVVEDDPTIAEVVERYLRNDGFDVLTEGDGTRALETSLADPPDLMILDLMLPGVGGLEICRQLRAMAPVPVIMLTARGDEDDRIIGLELGADDYVTKPFSAKELVARVRAVLRRSREAMSPAELPATLVDDDLVVDVAAHEARLDGEPLALTAREFELLVFLLRHPGVAFRREELLERVWGSRWGDTSTVTVHVRRLREKLESDPSSPTRLATVWGVGYRWSPADADPASDDPTQEGTTS